MIGDDATHFVAAVIVAIMAPLVVLSLRFPLFRGVGYGAVWIAMGALMAAGCLEQPEPELYTCTIVYRCATDPTPSAAIGFACATDDDEANERITSASWAVIAARCDIKALQYVRPLCSAYKPSEACEE